MIARSCTHRLLAVRRLAAALAIAALPACSPAPNSGGQELCAQVFSTNDMHGRLLPATQSWSRGRLVGGAAVLAAYVAERRAAAPGCPVFVISAGDFLQGTPVSNLTDGRATIDAMNAIGYDAAAVGNHEFDWGEDVLIERVGQADFAILGANIFLEDTDRHPEWVRPWTLVEKDGVRLGVVGAVTTSTPSVTRPSHVAHLDFRPISEALDRYIPEVRQAGADFVVVVMHEGAFCEADVCEGRALEALAETNERFDYAVTGHTHSKVEAEVRGVPVVQSFSNSAAFGVGRLDRNGRGEVSARRIGVFTSYADAVTPDHAVERLVESYAAELADLVERIIVTLPEALPAPRRGDFPLGRIIADAQRRTAGADIALMNNGGIRRPLPAGPVTYSDLFELQPFGNEIVLLTMTGAQLREALEQAVRYGDTSLQVSGIAVSYDPGAPAGNRIREALLADGTPVRPAVSYQIAVNDFLAAGGSGFPIFTEAESAEPTGVTGLQAVIDFLGAQPEQSLIPREPRWIESSGDGPSAAESTDIEPSGGHDRSPGPLH